MKQVLQLEELAQLVLAIAAFHFLPFQFAWWIWPFLFLLPDLSFLAYIMGTKIGGIAYNLFHHKGIAIAMAATGFFVKNDGLVFAGVMMYAHSSFDRMLGYGLKYADSFKHTHLGWLKGGN